MSEQGREGGREEGEKEVCHALDYNQCVFGTRSLVLVWRAPARLQLNLEKADQSFNIAFVDTAVAEGKRCLLQQWDYLG